MGTKPKNDLTRDALQLTLNPSRKQALDYIQRRLGSPNPSTAAGEAVTAIAEVLQAMENGKVIFENDQGDQQQYLVKTNKAQSL